MGRIAAGEGLGNAVPSAVLSLAPPSGAFGSRAAAGLEGLGGAIAGAGVEEQRLQNEAGRARAANSALDYEIAIKTKAEELRDALATGRLDYKDANRIWQETRTGIEMPTDPTIPPLVQEDLQRGIKRMQFGADTRVANAIDQAERQDYRGQFGAAFDKLGKLAGMPGANIAEINARADSVAATIGKQTGLPTDHVSKTLQDFKDKNWQSDAVNQAIMNRDNLPGLMAIEHDLTAADGFYAGKLDTDKRNAVLGTVVGHRIQLENRMDRQADKREANAGRLVAKAEAQIATGLPLSPDVWTKVRDGVAGTTYAADFVSLMQSERETQTVLRLPLDQQEQYVQQREAQLNASGGTMADRGNLQRIKATVERNGKELETAPLVANQRLTGTSAQPIDLNLLLQPNGPAQAQALFSDRMSTLGAMRAQLGPRVPVKPLLPQEAKVLVTVLDTLPPSTAAQVFGSLRQAIGDDEGYRGAMAQIAPDSPVKARAGMLAAMQEGVTLQSNWIRDDVSTSSRKVAETMLAGEAIIDKTKGQKAQDGKPHSLFIPDRAAFGAEFANQVGTLYRGRPGAQEVDLQSAMAYYVGKAAQTGAVLADPKSADSALVQESIKATLGTVVNFNGYGEVTAPLGMKRDTFEQKVRDAYGEQLRMRGMPMSMQTDLANYGLVNYRQDGSYVVTMGGVPVIDPKTRGPIVLDLVSLPGIARYRVPADQRIPTK